MGSKSDNLLKRLLATFKPEAEDHLNAMSSGLLELEKEKEQAESQRIIESIYREAHSLKGAARAVNLRQVETLCQAMESVFAAFKHGQLPASTEFYDAIHQSVDTLAQIVAAVYDETIKGPISLDEALQRLKDLVDQREHSGGSNTTELPQKTIDLHADSNFKSTCNR